jgi:hypothetical protein
MNDSKMLEIGSETQRRLPDLTFAQGVILTRDLPRDTVIKRIQIRLRGNCSYTFSAGSAVVPTESTLDSIVNRVDVTVNGSRVVKSIRPHIAQMQQLLATTVQAERKASAGAAAAYADNPTSDGGFVFGTTTQFTTVAESMTISFENQLAKVNKEATWLNLKGVASAEIRIQCSSLSNLDKGGATALVFTTNAFTFEITIVEQQGVPSEVAFSDLKQTTKDFLFTAQATEQVIDINRGNYLQAISLYCIQDANGAGGTVASRKLSNNNSVVDVKLLVNGSRIIKASTFQQLQAENRARFGVQAPYASGSSRLDGFAYLDLLDSGDPSSALPCLPPEVDNVQLLISTRASDATNNIYPLNLTIETAEIVTP